jgi:hypothetical protein
MKQRTLNAYSIYFIVYSVMLYIQDSNKNMDETVKKGNIILLDR